MGRSSQWVLALLFAWTAACATPVEPPAPSPPSAHVPAPVPAPVPSPAPSPAPSLPLPPEPLALQLPAIDKLLADAIAAGKLPGAVIAIGNSERIVWQRAYGDRALVPAREPMTLDTVFDLASLSKSVATTTAAMWLVEQGKLALDEKVASYVPEIPPSARFITVRQLLLHTSGLPSVVGLQELAGGPKPALARILKTEPEAMPGTRYQYSDIGFIWLGVVLERAAGEPLEALVKRVMLDPLGMTDSRYITTSGQKPEPRWLARVAPTELTETRNPPRIIHGEVHDPLAYRIGGAAGNAGLFSTAADLSRFARMLLGRGSLIEGAGRTLVLGEATVAALTEPRGVAGFRRTYGWDVKSPHSRNRGKLLSPLAFGHGGFTGTALWIDPEQDLFVVLLSNRVHPNGKGNVIELTARVTDAAVAGVARAAECPRPHTVVLPGVDVLRIAGFDLIRGKRVGLLTHRAAHAYDGTETLEVFARASEFTLAAVLTPEHGLDAKDEGVIASATHEASARRVPVFSLFGKRKRAPLPPGAPPPPPIKPPYSEGRRPTEEMLEGLDVIVIDLVDVGTRFYTYASTVRETLIAASEARLPVIVLDRPNPLGAERVEGPMLDPGIRSFVNHYPLPIRHGMTLGELATLMVRELSLRVDLEVVRAGSYHRALGYPLGLGWYPPSPNLTSVEAALLYPAVGVIEGTNVSVGRGTDAPFAQLGAPFIDATRFTAALNASELPGVRLDAITFTPSTGPHRGQACHGVELTITDEHAYSSSLTALALIRALYGEPGWDDKQLMRLLGHRRTWSALKRNVKLEDIVSSWQPELDAFAARRQDALLYPLCSPEP